MTRNKLNVFADQLVRHDYESAVEFFLENMTPAAAKNEALASFVPVANREKILESCLKSGTVLQESNFIMSAKRAQSVKQQIHKMLSAHADSHSAPPEYSIESVRAKVSNAMDRQLFQHFLKELSESGQITRSGDKIALKTDKAPTLSHAESVRADQVMGILNATLCLEIDEISKMLKTDRKSIMSTLQTLSKQDKAHVVDHDYASSSEAIHKAHAALAKIWETRKEISPSEFRETVGTSRKYAMALLAYFDNKLITRRVNNTRMLIKAP
jgi:selenocysteine-specific elongation factor